MNVTLVPEQIVEADGVILTAGVTVEFPSLIPLLVAVVFCKHGEALEVRTT